VQNPRSKELREIRIKDRRERGWEVQVWFVGGT
jgi:hypothetical protein